MTNLQAGPAGQNGESEMTRAAPGRPPPANRRNPVSRPEGGTRETRPARRGHTFIALAALAALFSWAGAAAAQCTGGAAGSPAFRATAARRPIATSNGGPPPPPIYAATACRRTASSATRATRRCDLASPTSTTRAARSPWPSASTTTMHASRRLLAVRGRHPSR